jgi:hypothetical protein
VEMEKEEIKKEEKINKTRNESVRRKDKDLRYGAGWAEGDAKNRVEKLPPKGANAS